MRSYFKLFFIPFLLTIAADAEVNLSQPVFYNAGAIPVSLAVGDLDQDGDPDVAVLNRQGHLRVFLNNGAGCFSSFLNFAKMWPATTDGSWPGFPSMVDFAISDFDGDGRNDVAATWGENLGVVSFARNRGNAAFDAPANFRACGHVAYLTAANLNQDSTRDIAVTSTCFKTTVLLNDGQGRFAMNGSFGQGYTSGELASGDLDGDLDQDIAFLNVGISNVALVFNDGNGTFSNTGGYSTGDNPHDLVLADLDGDRDLDIATANFYSNNVSLLWNDGSGVFPARAALGAGSGPDGIASGDLNQDRLEDLAIVNRNGYDLLIFLNQGNKAFSPPNRHATGQTPNDVAVADLNRDGKNDVLVLNHFTENLAVYLNQAQACATPPPTTVPNKIEVPFFVKGVISNRQRLVFLNWSDVRSGSLTVFRNGRKFLTTANDGYHWDDVSKVKGQTLKYKVCEVAPFDSCSAELSVTF
ncbi:VCBS repeat-containing protein [bacterium]|nr:VCBS repeat-containing protein [bacterium]